ncbi:MAG: phage terminase large subunit [Defluviitaleaceae bacterium]|nr:phage terminase large subunit [Defluviitaleaceae bacterium]MCL2261675.1 phage terminase large subunit [Defluviitaleaceae bacterium]
MNDVQIRPQEGPQWDFLATPADIAIYGGAAGGGKTFGLLLSPLKHVNDSKFGAVIFRKHSNQISVEGGLWDESQKIYSNWKGAKPRITPHPRWIFPSGAKVSFRHIERDECLSEWQGSQICEISFDELTHFTKKQFFYMLSRNRSVCGVRPYMRATCNPDADSWVAEFIAWWIDPDTGYPIPERSGVIRWFIRRDEILHWADTCEELWERFNLDSEEERALPKSVTFIASTLSDNKILMESDPSYLSNLEALPLVERERLMHGNWKIKPSAGMYFKRTEVGEMLSNIPVDVVKWVRAWDLAATTEKESTEAAFTSGVLIGKRRNGRYIVADVINKRLDAGSVRALVKLTAQQDKARFNRVRIRVPQDPGQAGKEQAQSYVKFLAGFDVCAKLESGSKETRAEPFSAQWRGGNVDVLTADWNEAYFNQLESFPISKFKDMVDASGSAFNEIEIQASGWNKPGAF